MKTEWEEIVNKDLEDRKIDEAIDVCNKQIEQAGKNTKNLKLRSICYMKKEDFGKSLADLDQAMKLSKEKEEKNDLICLKVDLMRLQDKLSGSIEYLIEEMKVNPGQPKLESKKSDLLKIYEKDYGLPYDSPEMQKIEVFIKWMEMNGAKFNKIRMKYYSPDFRGVHTYKEIEQNELFLYVPKKLIISSQSGRECPIGAKIAASKVKLSWDYLSYISIFLMTQMHDASSFWKPYMDVYPRIVDNFPIFYSPEEKELLRGSPMYQQIITEIKEIQDEYNLIGNAVPEFKKEFTCEEYMKNKTLVISRIFFVKMQGVTERIMVPLADMFNHYYDKVGQTYWKYVDADDSFVVTAQRKIPIGDAICENYGQKPNYRFLFYYGFVIDENRKNAIYVKLHFNQADPNLAKKKAMIGSAHNTYIKQFKFFEHFEENEKPNSKFLSYIRFIEYTGDLEDIRGSFTPPIDSLKNCPSKRRKLKLPAFDIVNERKMLTKLRFIADLCYKKYTCPYEDDVILLEKEGKTMSFNKKNAIVFRMGEKKILKNLIQMSEVGLILMGKKNEAEAQEVLMKMTNPPYRIYLEKTLMPLIAAARNKMGKQEKGE